METQVEDRKVVALVDGLLLRKTKLNCDELAFLAAQIRETQKTIASFCAMSPEHLCRVLNGKANFKPASEKLFRFVIAACCREELCKEILFTALPYKE